MNVFSSLVKLVRHKQQGEGMTLLLAAGFNYMSSKQ